MMKKEETTKVSPLNVRIPVDVHKELKKYAIDHDVMLKDYITQLIVEDLRKHGVLI